MLRSWLTIGALLLAIAAVLAADIYNDRQKTESREQRHLLLIADAVKVNMREQLRASSRMLDTLINDLPVLSKSRDGMERMNHRMALLAGSVIGLRSILLVGADGVVMASNRAELIGQDFKDSERYRTIKAGNASDMLYISPPFKTPLGVFTTSLGKAVVNAQGQFDGYVLAILDPEYFGVLMNSLIYAPDMRLAVIHGDGKVIFSTLSTPSIEGVDLSLKSESLFNRHMQSGRPSNFMVDQVVMTGDLRFIVFQTVFPASGSANKPLVVTASRTSDAVFAEWRKSALNQGMLFAGLVLAVLVGHYVYWRRKRAYRMLHLEKRQGEEAAQERIRESDELFRGYFENLAVGAVQLDAEGRYQLVNDRYCQIIGYNREELIGKMRPSELSHPEERVYERERMRAFFAENDKNIDLEKRIIRKNGQVIWVHISAHAVRDEQGKAKYAAVVIEDITQRKRLMTELEEAKLVSEAASRAKTLFLGNMSHEMRTPLHQISGIAALFRRDALTDKQSLRLGLLEAAVKRLDTVIGGILTLVDIESGSTTVEMEAVDMGEIVDGVVSMVAGSAADKGLLLRQEVSPLPSPVLGDARHLRTILSCYCNNAITFSERGEITVRVGKLGEDAGSVMLRIEVEDQGTGIAPEHIDRLFGQFEQVDNSHTRKYGGTGVGLAIVKKLAGLMGGDAGCQSVLGQGSVFWVSVRLAKVAPDELAERVAVEDFQI